MFCITRCNFKIVISILNCVSRWDHHMSIIWYIHTDCICSGPYQCSICSPRNMVRVQWTACLSILTRCYCHTIGMSTNQNFTSMFSASIFKQKYLKVLLMYEFDTIFCVFSSENRTEHDSMHMVWLQGCVPIWSGICNARIPIWSDCIAVYLYGLCNVWIPVWSDCRVVYPYGTTV